MMELLKLPNVRLHEKCSNFTDEVLHKDAKSLAWEVATKHPLWTIEVTGHRDYQVFADGEKIGQIGAEWYGSQQKLYVRNDRIGEGNTRKNAYHTDKVDKALLKVKKTFGRMTLSERMEKAYKEAERVVDQQMWSANHRHRDHERPIERMLMEWAQQNAAQYYDWLKATNKVEILEHIEQLEKVNADMMTIKEVTNAMQNSRNALIVLSDGKYIVKIRDNVQLYDDVTFPVELRGKLGMLKLVEKEQMVTGIGCRVSDEIFVLMLDEEKTDGE
jgi:hypothetical protein